MKVPIGKNNNHIYLLALVHNFLLDEWRQATRVSSATASRLSNLVTLLLLCRGVNFMPCNTGVPVQMMQSLGHDFVADSLNLTHELSE